MKILYIHGLGSGKFSETPKRLREALPEAEVLSPEIPIDPAEAARFLKDNFLNDTSIDLVVGSSLGGFYSLLLPHHKKLLMNPALFADEDIEQGIGLGQQEFLSPRENGTRTYVIDGYFIHALEVIRRRIFKGYPQHLGKPSQEQIRNTWAIFADDDELLHHYEDFCRLFRADHAFRMSGEHRVSEKNMQVDIVPLLKHILGKATMMDNRRKPKSLEDVYSRNPDIMKSLNIDFPEALVASLGDRYIPAKREELLEQLLNEKFNEFLRRKDEGDGKSVSILVIGDTGIGKSTRIKAWLKHLAASPEGKELEQWEIECPWYCAQVPKGLDGEILFGTNEVDALNETDVVFLRHFDWTNEATRKHLFNFVENHRVEDFRDGCFRLKTIERPQFIIATAWNKAYNVNYKKPLTAEEQRIFDLVMEMH